MPPSLLLKLVLTPVLIATATLVGRRWGPALSGWLVGLPLTSGPVVFFLALDQGRPFATDVSLGVILGVASQAVFALGYVRLGRTAGWPWRLLAGTAAFVAATIAFRLIRVPGYVEPIFVFATLLLSIALMPGLDQVEHQPVPSPPGDLPLRIVIATVLVLGLTAIAPVLGSYLSGLVTPFPLYAAILAVFAHRLDGAAAAAAVWRGLLLGLFSFLAFFTVLAVTLESAGIALGFLLAIAGAGAVQAATFLVLRSAPHSRN